MGIWAAIITFFLYYDHENKNGNASSMILTVTMCQIQQLKESAFELYWGNRPLKDTKDERERARRRQSLLFLSHFAMHHTHRSRRVQRKSDIDTGHDTNRGFCARKEDRGNFKRVIYYSSLYYVCFLLPCCNSWQFRLRDSWEEIRTLCADLAREYKSVWISFCSSALPLFSLSNLDAFNL